MPELNSHYGPVPRRKLAHEVRDRLIDLITGGELGEGDQLPSEADLMRSFEVGRPAVREALQSLESIGLISIHQGERAKVKKVTLDNILGSLDLTASYLLSSSEAVDNLREARHMFESAVVRIAVDRADSKSISKLKKKLDIMSANLADQAAFVKADQEFHIAIAEMTKNPIFVAVSKAMLQWLYKHQPLLLGGKSETNQLTFSEHKKIYDKIAKRDNDGAEKSLSDHLLRVHKLYREYYDL